MQKKKKRVKFHVWLTSVIDMIFTLNRTDFSVSNIGCLLEFKV